MYVKSVLARERQGRTECDSLAVPCVRCKPQTKQYMVLCIRISVLHGSHN